MHSGFRARPRRRRRHRGRGRPGSHCRIEPNEGRHRNKARPQHALDDVDGEARANARRSDGRSAPHEREAAPARDPARGTGGTRPHRGSQAPARDVGMARARRDRGPLARLLIVNADDFGRSDGIDNGIVRAHHEGIVTSTTFMTNAPSSPHAASLARATPTLDLGAHLVLTYARPLSNPAQIRSLVRKDGSFWRPSELLARPIDRSEALTEYRAQYARARELAGREPTHVDTHHCIHYPPSLSCAVDVL